VLTVLTVGVVNGDAVDSDAVVTVVTSGVLAVVCDSVVNVVGLTVLSVTKHKRPHKRHKLA